MDKIRKKVTHRPGQKATRGLKNIAVRPETYERILTYGKDESFDSILTNILDTLELRAKIPFIAPTPLYRPRHD